MSRPGPAFYARSGSRWSDWWTLLHPPYTLWHLSYVAVGAALVPRMDWFNLTLALVAFLLAVGVAAHALDELHGRPLRTRIGAGTLKTVSAATLLGAAVVGAYGTWHARAWFLLVLIPAGVLLVVAYNLELFAGRLHNDATFAWAWGGFPVLVGFTTQVPDPEAGMLVSAAAAVLGAVALSLAQRRLSTPARTLRRRSAEVSGTIVLTDGTRQHVDVATLLTPVEATLRALCWAVPLLALALLARHLPM